MSAQNDPIRIYPEGIAWDEAWRQRQRSDALAVDVERLNEMLRQTGYGQGQIDAYVAQCEEMDALKATIDELTQDRNRFLRERDASRKELADVLYMIEQVRGTRYVVNPKAGGGT